MTAPWKCGTCREPTTTGDHLCRECGQDLEQLLAEVPSLAHDLELTRTRQAKTAGAGVGFVSRSEERPVPWDDRASKATVALAAAVRRAADLATDRTDPLLGPHHPTCAHPSCVLIRVEAKRPTALPDVARWLLVQLPWLRAQPAAPALQRRLAAASDRARTVIDLPPEQVYAGICSASVPHGEGDTARVELCPVDLYAEEGAATTTCPACGTEHDMTRRRKVLLDAVDDQLAGPATLSQALSRLGHPVTASTIRSWVHRGRLVAHGTDNAGADVYRVGDVITLVHDRDARAARRAADDPRHAV